jgi:hypothetical protein
MAHLRLISRCDWVAVRAAAQARRTNGSHRTAPKIAHLRHRLVRDLLHAAAAVRDVRRVVGAPALNEPHHGVHVPRLRVRGKIMRLIIKRTD